MTTTKHLPSGILSDKVKNWTGQSAPWKRLEFPFTRRVVRSDVGAIAEHIANFIEDKTGEAQVVEDVSDPHSMRFVLKSTSETPNYEVLRIGVGTTAYGGSYKGLILVQRRSLCQHPEETLDAYVKAVKRKLK